MTEDEFEEQGIYLRLRVRAEQTAESAKMAIMAENRMMVEIAVSAERRSSTAIYINTTLHA